MLLISQLGMGMQDVVICGCEALRKEGEKPGWQAAQKYAKCKIEVGLALVLVASIKLSSREDLFYTPNPQLSGSQLLTLTRLFSVLTSTHYMILSYSSSFSYNDNPRISYDWLTLS